MSSPTSELKEVGHKEGLNHGDPSESSSGPNSEVDDDRSEASTSVTQPTATNLGAIVNSSSSIDILVETVTPNNPSHSSIVHENSSSISSTKSREVLKSDAGSSTISPPNSTSDVTKKATALTAAPEVPSTQLEEEKEELDNTLSHPLSNDPRIARNEEPTETIEVGQGKQQAMAMPNSDLSKKDAKSPTTSQVNGSAIPANVKQNGTPSSSANDGFLHC
mmetsp:Transcript_38972/g.94221  ORF Transcript_38972/g.94221 Transcript_38972/m.94221 type:complete len:220 (-) Transcript_38972:2903-3562(-)